ncbi:hypothetical protein N7540_007606 [Penicillium herquei]|nr:hypothetical protein N7540_007606 [Penicillium herquei]
MPETSNLPLLQPTQAAAALPPPPKRARLGISDTQKQALRAFWSNSSPRPTQSPILDQKLSDWAV